MLNCRAGQAGGRRALWRDGQSSNILDTDLSALGPYLSVLGGGRSAERRFGSNWRDGILTLHEDSTVAWRPGNSASRPVEVGVARWL